MKNKASRKDGKQPIVKNNLIFIPGVTLLQKKKK